MGLFDRKKKDKDKDKEKWQDAVLTLYACRGDMDIIPDKIKEAFSGLGEELSRTESGSLRRREWPTFSLRQILITKRL